MNLFFWNEAFAEEKGNVVNGNKSKKYSSKPGTKFNSPLTGNFIFFISLLYEFSQIRAYLWGFPSHLTQIYLINMSI